LSADITKFAFGLIGVDGTLPDVTATGPATPLPSLECHSAVIQAMHGNIGYVRVGDSNTGAARGYELFQGEPIAITVNNLNEVYIYGNGTDKVAVLYIL